MLGSLGFWACVFRLGVFSVLGCSGLRFSASVSFFCTAYGATFFGLGVFLFSDCGVLVLLFWGFSFPWVLGFEAFVFKLVFLFSSPHAITPKGG